MYSDFSNEIKTIIRASVKTQEKKKKNEKTEPKKVLEIGCGTAIIAQQNANILYNQIWNPYHLRIQHLILYMFIVHYIILIYLEM